MCSLTSDSDKLLERRLQMVCQARVDGRPESIELLLSAIDDEDEKVREAAALGIGALELDAGIPSLKWHLLHDPSPVVRDMCISGLWFAPQAELLSTYLEALRDPCPHVVAGICHSLRWLGDRSAATPLNTLLHHDVWQVRHAVCQALIEIDSVDEEVVQELTRLMDDPKSKQHDDNVAGMRRADLLVEDPADRFGEGFRTIAESLAIAKQMLARGSAADVMPEDTA